MTVCYLPTFIYVHFNFLLNDKTRKFSVRNSGVCPCLYILLLQILPVNSYSEYQLIDIHCILHL